MAEAVEKDSGQETLHGDRKAAAFLLALDSDTAASILRNLTQAEVTRLTEQMARIQELHASEMDSVLIEFQGSLDQVAIEPLLEDLLVKALGPDRAKEMLDRIRRRHRESEPFRALRKLSSSQLQVILRGEHPQVLALVVSYLKPEAAYEMLHSYEEDLRYDVIRRIAMTEEMPYDMVRQVDALLEARAVEMSSHAAQESERNRFKTIAQVLNLAEVGVTKGILDKMAKELPQAAEEVQSLMFVFEDLAGLADRDLQKVMSDVDKADLALAMKTATEEVKAKLLANLSARARQNLLDEIEMMGPKPLSEVEEAQKNIVEKVREMGDKGEINLHQTGEEYV